MSSNSFFMVILWSRQLDRSDQTILPDSGIKESAIAQHGLLVPKLLAKFPLSGAEAAKEGPSPCLVKRTGPCLYVGPTFSTHSHCQPMPERAPVQPSSANCFTFKGPFQPKLFDDSMKLQSWLVGKSLNSLHASAGMGLD